MNDLDRTLTFVKILFYGTIAVVAAAIVILINLYPSGRPPGVPLLRYTSLHNTIECNVKLHSIASAPNPTGLYVNLYDIDRGVLEKGRYVSETFPRWKELPVGIPFKLKVNIYKVRGWPDWYIDHTDKKMLIDGLTATLGQEPRPFDVP